MNTVEEYIKKYVLLGIKDRVLYNGIKQETEIEMDKIIEEASNKFSYLEIRDYIHQNFDVKLV